MHYEIRNVISGLTPVAKSSAILAALCYLRASKNASANFEIEKQFDKKDEAFKLIDFAPASESLIKFEFYLTEGAEQQVYLFEDGKFVLKTNDAIFYETWEEYLVSLLLHNYFFPATAYELMGFIKIKDKILSLVKQAYIIIDEVTDLENVKSFMTINGFENIRNNDYQNNAINVIIEDLHDENVVMSKGLMFFIDTVIYIKK